MKNRFNSIIHFSFKTHRINLVEKRIFKSTYVKKQKAGLEIHVCIFAKSKKIEAQLKNATSLETNVRNFAKGKKVKRN